MFRGPLTILDERILFFCSYEMIYNAVKAIAKMVEAASMAYPVV